VHIRGAIPREPENLSGFQEVFGDAIATGAPLHVVHIQVSGGQDVVQELEMIRGARSRGIDVTAEAYPYDSGAGRIESSLFDTLAVGLGPAYTPATRTVNPTAILLPCFGPKPAST
jgi:hypothetical protein